ncbi:MAG: PilZ domain-containing protein [Verrucomicrobiota bacterium]|jgi:PilZ domain
MSAKRFVNGNAFDKPVTVEARQAKLELSADTVSIHKSGIEFRSPTPFMEWAEMTVSLQSPVSGHQLSCTGVIIACTGNKHAGYHVSMIFTSLTPQAEKQLGIMARSKFGAG